MISHSSINIPLSHPWSILLISSSIVWLCVSKRVVLAPLHLCSLLNMFAVSRSQALIHTQKIPSIDDITITITPRTYLDLHPYEHISVLVLVHCMHVCMNVLSVHVALISMSIIDILATAFDFHNTQTYIEQTLTDICTYSCRHRYHILLIS